MPIDTPSPDRADFKAALARRWAPVHYQDVDTSNYRADYVCAVNFDGNWDTIGNWDALDDYPLIPTVYYSVEETYSHWYIIYMFYRPRDWTDAPWALFFDQHENDAEGFLTTIRKPRNWWERIFFPMGIFEAMVTVAHHDFYSFSNTLQGNRETVDGPVRFTRLNGMVSRIFHLFRKPKPTPAMLGTGASSPAVMAFAIILPARRMHPARPIMARLG